MITKIARNLWLLLALFVLAGCIPPGSVSSTPIIAPTSIAATEPGSSSGPNPPVTLVALNGKTLEFKCLVDAICIPDIDLSQHITIEQPYVLDNVLYWDSANVYVLLYSTNSTSPFKRVVVHINPQTGETIAAEVPEPLSDVPFHIGSAIAEGKLILTNYTYNKVYIFNHDLSVVVTQIDFGAEGLIETGSREVIALSKKPLENEGSAFIGIALIDVVSGQVTNKRLAIPMFDIIDPQATVQVGKKHLVRVEGISTDLKQIYARYSVGDKLETLLLGTIDIQSAVDVASTDNPQLTNIAGNYTQYRNMLYRSYIPCSECSGPGAQLVNMSTITSLITPEQLRAATGNKFEVIPFGQFFLLETNGQVIVLSPNGKITTTYSVPEEWANRDYRVVQYRK